MIDQVDWDGALTHRVGKIHEVGLFNLKREANGTLARQATPLVKMFSQYASRGEESVGTLDRINYPSPETDEEQLPPIGEWIQPSNRTTGGSRRVSRIDKRQSRAGRGSTELAEVPWYEKRDGHPIASVQPANQRITPDRLDRIALHRSLRHRRLLSPPLGFRLATPAAVPQPLRQETPDSVYRRAVLRSPRRGRAGSPAPSCDAQRHCRMPARVERMEPQSEVARKTARVGRKTLSNA